MRGLFITGLSLAALGLAACSDDAAMPTADPPSQLEKISDLPDVARCEAQRVRAPDEPLPSGPLEIPAAFRATAATGPATMALVTQSGEALCADFIWVSNIDGMDWLKDDRLLGWEWNGFEAFGYTIADLAGGGTLVFAGSKPVFSPSGTRFADVQVSDAGWGGLEGLAVWELRDDDTVEIGRHAMDGDFEHPKIFQDPMGEWSIVGWHGESCIDIRMVPYDQFPAPDPPSPQTYHASGAANWQVAPGACS